MWSIEIVVFITGAFVIMLVGCAIGAFIEANALEYDRTHKPIEEEYYFIKGDGVTENVPLPSSWTLSDAYFLRDLLRDKYAVGCVILCSCGKGEFIEV